ncbi:LPXTG cell wall anchor domain-containing protein [Lactobacillus crispatus]|uniref:LPXTG cell wall anchor domain-containing protein n=1 Tax=Lactobacillus crispatus TaxID=47770 RepID=UPI0032B3520D
MFLTCKLGRRLRLNQRQLDNQLPQTGNDNSLTLMGLGASTLLGMFGLAAVNKKRK